MYTHCPIIVAVSGLAILIIGIVSTWYGFPALVEWQINKNTIMENTSQAFKVWKKQPFPMLFKVYLFNVTNTDSVMAGATPILKEVGPYVYDIHIERDITEIDDDADTIKYFLIKKFHFNTKASGCRSEHEMITIINAPLMGTLLKVESIAPQMLNLVNDAYTYIYPGITDMFLRVHVSDLLFGGITLFCSAEEIKTLCSAMRFSLPSNMKRAKNNKDFIFSMFGKFNETAFGPFEMTRGITNTTRGSLISYKEDPVLDYWSGDLCNMLNGSDSGLYERMTEPVDKIYSFNPEICRSIGISFEKKITRSNFAAYKYSITEESLSHKGSDQCFCEEVGGEYECPLDGLLNLDSCIRAPILMSNPHFYLADKSLLNYTKGMHPLKTSHESFLIIEPNTATPVSGAKRVQMNVEVKQFEAFPLTRSMPEGVFPILWIEEGVDLPSDLLAHLEFSFRKIAYLDFLKWILIVAGVVLIILAFILIMKREGLMCFASKGSLQINDGKNMVTHIRAFEDISFTAPTGPPQADDPIFKIGKENNNNSNVAWPYRE
uniref:Sensory neuron membrane protein 2 n=1 Tax=Holotrichia parallela TaxID=93412 RepID=A0A2P1ERQ2_HOLPA|nr:sensory neuron membrane protein 2 [Holotrichia parallela]